MDILDKARALVDGDRNDAYGDPATKYSQISQLWSLLFGTPISPEQVLLAMCAIKLVRSANRSTYNQDDLIDLCGYALMLSRIQNKQNEN
jgi:hypothetical protein